MLRAEVNTNSCRAIEELSNILIQLWSIIQEYFQQIDKIGRASVWVPYNQFEENKANRSTACIFPFSNELTRSSAKSDLHSKKLRLRVWWSICGIVTFEVLKLGQTVNPDLYCEQLDRVN